MSKTFNYKQAAKQLRAFGLGGDYDLRRSFTPQQKSAITKKFQQYASIVKNPDNFQIVTVKSKTAKQISVAAKQIKIKNSDKTKLIIPIEKGQKVKIKKGKAVFREKGFSETVYPGGADFFNQSEKVFKKKLKRGEYITVRIGKSKAFNRTFTDRMSLLNYMRDWSPKDQNKNDLIQHISIVKIEQPKRKRK